MPARTRSGSRHLEDALLALTAALDDAEAPWMIIGGIAGIACGIRRFTTDIDAAVRGDATTPEQLLASFAKHRISPRIPDAIAFAQQNLVLLARHEPTGVDLDVSLAWSGFEHEALTRPIVSAFGRVNAPMCAPQDLLVFKAIAGRPKDAEDAKTILLLHPKLDLAAVRARVADLAAVAEVPEILSSFDEWVRATSVHRSNIATPISAPPTPHRRPPRKPR